MSFSAFTTAERVAEVRRSSLRPALSPAPQGAVSLAMGEPDFDTPAPIVEAAERALREGHTHYANQQGLPELRAALAEGLPGDVTWAAEDVLITHGATGGLAALIYSVVGPGDRVVIPEPAYSLYADLVRLAGGTVQHVPLAADLHWDLEALRSALPGARMIIFSNPGNPTGIVHTRRELKALGQMLEGTETLVVADEAYSRLVYGDRTFVSALEVEELAGRTVYVQTFSKAYAMTGWRIGYVVASPQVLSGVALVHRTSVGSMNTAVQLAALTALRLDEEELRPMLKAYARRREIVIEELSEVPIPGFGYIAPEGAFYAMIRYGLDRPSFDVAEDLKAQGVVVRAGAEYGPSGEGMIRISFAASEEHLRTGLRRIIDTLIAR